VAEGSKSEAKLRVFVSYSRDDLEFADQLVAALAPCGFEPTIDRHGISGGEDWQNRLGKLIQEADTVAFVLSPSSAASEICRWEVDEAARLGKRIIPVVCRALAGVSAPPTLERLNYIFFYAEPDSPGSGFGAGLAGLVTALNTDLDWMREHTRLQQRAIEWETSGRSPYRLLTGSDVAGAKEWLARQPQRAAPPTEVHLAFIRESEQAEEARGNVERRRLEEMAAAQAERETALEAAEAAAREREAAVQQAALEQKGRAEALAAVARTNRRNMRLTWAVLAIVAAFFAAALWQARKTDVREAKVAASLARRAAADHAYESAMRIAAYALPAEGRTPFSLAWDDPEITAVEAHLGGAAQLSALVRMSKPHFGIVTSVMFDPAGKRILSSSVDGTTKLGEGKKVFAGHVRFGEPRGPVLFAAFDAKGERIVTASKDGRIRVWDVATSRQLARFEGHQQAANSAVFNGDGTAIVSASDDGLARVWDAGSGEMKLELSGHVGPVASARFDPAGSRIVTASSDGAAIIWDAATGSEIRRITVEGPVQRADFSPDGKRLALAYGDRMAGIFDAETGQLQVALRGHDGRVQSIAFSPDGGMAITASADTTARVWSAISGEELERFVGHATVVMDARFNADGSLAVTAGTNGIIRVWDARKRDESIRLEGHVGAVISVAVSADGKRIVTGSDDGTARLWDSESGLEIRQLGGHGGPVNAVAANRDGSLIATASSDRTIRVWAVAQGSDPMQISGHTGVVNSVAISEDGKRLLSASSDFTARVWDVEGGKQTLELRGHSGPVNSAAFGPKENAIVTASGDGTVRVWDAATGAPKTRGTYNTEANAAHFSPNGRLIAIALADHRIRIWNLKQVDQTQTLGGHVGPVNSVAFSPDGLKVVSASNDRTVRVWDIASGTEILKVDRHQGRVNQAVFSGDGSQIVSASSDLTARIWDTSWLVGSRHAALKDRACKEKLIYDTRIFKFADAFDPTMQGLAGTNACGRTGPFTWRYWQDVAGTAARQVAALWKSDDEAGKLEEKRQGVAPPKFADIADGYRELFRTASVREENRQAVDWMTDLLVKYRERYEKVEKATEVPWYMVGIIHGLETSFDFRGHFHNGDSLEKRTVHVPAGRPLKGEPPFTWEESAIDAMQLFGFAGQSDWALAQVLYRLERYNGFRTRVLYGINSPYLWSCTNHYTKGKFVRDNVFDPNAVSKQCGGAAILKTLMARNVISLSQD
jgi:WD40 repeat protein/lysozyme family protein